MPELPEVETVRRDLNRLLAGRIFGQTGGPFPGSVKGIGFKDLRKKLLGRKIVKVNRRAKYLLLSLDPGLTLIIHLKMTGVLQHQQKDDSLPKSARIIFYFKDGTRLVFSDQRKFGSIKLTDDPNELPEIRKLGPEPLDGKFTPAVLKQRLAGRKGPVKTLLLDQTVLAGLGNIYVLEALHRAGIAPQRSAAAINDGQIKKLHSAIVRTLKEAIAARGSSVDTYRDGQGKSGWFQVKHRVYGKEGHSCKKCGHTIVKEMFRGRGTYWCPKCQR
ncbi:MAG: bifunctional DNA-formamidopyrimidine glycosylase/DNA-(apurinic or apyrimidinic site) lyase [bacterium]|nr:bifunctional DNA-formamidopyrimidine glycosylase/DNA-(apurinic or apyrimidinic site) lyase [bacterium]